MKKIILFFMFLLFPIMINADEKTIFSLDEVTASSGNNVTINLNLQNKQKFGVLTARIHFDNSKIEYVSSELKGLKSGTIKGTDDNNDKGLVAIYAISLNQKKLMADNGNILTIEFKIKDDVSGDIPIELEIVDFGVEGVSNLTKKAAKGAEKKASNAAWNAKDTRNISENRPSSTVRAMKAEKAAIVAQQAREEDVATKIVSQSFDYSKGVVPFHALFS